MTDHIDIVIEPLYKEEQCADGDHSKDNPKYIDRFDHDRAPLILI